MIDPCAITPCILPILIAGVLSLGCRADLPEQLAKDASLDLPCTPYADRLVSFGPDGEGDSQVGSLALGPPDNQSAPLPVNGVLQVGFVGLGSFTNQPGDDLRVHATSSGDALLAVYVGASPDDMDFSGNLSPGDFDIDIAIASAPATNFVRVVGLTGNAEIDAFEVLQPSCP